MNELFETALALLLSVYGSRAELSVSGDENDRASVRVSPVFPASLSPENHPEGVLLREKGRILLCAPDVSLPPVPLRSALFLDGIRYAVSTVSSVRGPGNTILAYELSLTR